MPVQAGEHSGGGPSEIGTGKKKADEEKDSLAELRSASIRKKCLKVVCSL